MTYLYPPAGTQHLVERLTTLPPSERARRWVMRDDNQQHYHGAVRVSKRPLLLELLWKPTATGAHQRVGYFLLHLPELLAADLIRFDQEEEPGDRVRIRFFRAEDEIVYVQARAGGPRLPIGSVTV